MSYPTHADRSRLENCAAACALLLALASCGPRGEGRPGPPPDILLVTLDTVRADRLGAYGYGSAETPAFDRLAREGTLYTRAWTTAPLTTPAHASLMTGLYPRRHGVRGNGLDVLGDEAETLAEGLAAAGYETAAFIGALPVTKRFGLDQGFETWDEDFGLDHRGDPRAERTADVVADRAIAWLAERNEEADRPFFLWVHFYDPHLPWEAPVPWGTRLADPYDAEIAFTDAQLARILEAVEAAAGDRDTVVVVAADHGEGLEDHGERAHGMLLYEESIRIPLVIRAPGVFPENRREDRLVSLVDIAPTLRALADAEAASQGSGIDLTPSGGWFGSRGGGATGDPLTEPGEARVVYAETLRPWRDFGWSPLAAIRREDRKWIEAPGPELYDLSVDPGERDDLAGEIDSDLGVLLASILEEGPADGSPRPHGMDAATLERLRSLGYAGLSSSEPPRAGESGGPPFGVGVDPKDAIRRYESFVDAEQALGRGNIAGCAQALSILRTLVQKEPENVIFRLERAVALLCMEDDLRAEIYLTELLAEHPENISVNWRLAEAMQRQGRPEEGYRLMADLRKRQSPSMVLDEWTAEAAMLADRPEAVIEIAEQARGRDRLSAKILLMEAEALRDLDRQEEALDRYHQILERRPSHKRALVRAVFLLDELGRRAEARLLLDRALESSPGNAAIRQLVERLAEELGPEPEAAALRP